ncbi:hypothetical protein KGM_215659 [Danaus plexippus plexippus]|uniref:Uncharacterized protein n=1 Tax=Danaus plexippus plexippus TaxID=278856 RepID=A0A212EPY5_DANPL|nr:hypothetical protein KGM_215659 [Danaus plexippus plexippus]
MKHTRPAKIVELLDSDDELPDDYYEEQTLPAYENDHRFDMIQFKWISKASPKKLTTKSIPTRQQSHVIIRPEKQSFRDRPIVNKGVLSKNDLYCIKSIEGYGDSTLIWFINFSILKDLQSNYTFLKSCLVNKYCSD